MKKVVMLSAAAILGMSSIAVSQAEETILKTEATTEVAATTEESSVKETESKDAEAPTEEKSEDTETEKVEEETKAPAEEEKSNVPVDTAQVAKLKQLYPRLVARIQPYGVICYEGEDCDVTVMSMAASADGGPRDGKVIYDMICKTCHATGLLGSPKLGDAGAWGARIGQGMDTLYDHAINGYNAMPARGGADIPDEEVSNAVDYMVSKAQ